MYANSDSLLKSDQCKIFSCIFVGHDRLLLDRQNSAKNICVVTCKTPFYFR